ncbi:PREDICTED: CD226 antigen [Thamnophis sirtalis]|uniref:CD226 antigen n=1 Tax=Thamnophis sirtalis TaxID=35019 RepID=A0A6I9XUD1_9SAUR|nr:PREDICTED: CD226 antigen [Thamnophis sirtalis]
MNCLVFLVMAFLQSYQSNVSLMAEGKHVDSIVKLSSTMALKCVCPMNASISQMVWEKEENQTKQLIAAFRLPYDLHIESNYKARVLVTNFTSDNKTLIFSNATEKDVGFYLCSFHTFPHGILEKTIHVVQSGAFEFSNLSIHHLITKPGENVTFKYPFNSDVAVNQMTWERVQPDCIDLIIQCADSEMPIYGSDYQNRVDCISESSFVLLDVTASDYGMYRFSYDKVNGENGTGWIKLSSNNFEPLFTKLHIIFIGSGAFLILIILIILIYRSFCVTKKRKRIKKMRDYKDTCRQSQHQYKNWAGQRSANSSQNPTATEDPIYANWEQVMKK